MPVIVGLVIGIGFIAMFTFAFTNDYSQANTAEKTKPDDIAFNDDIDIVSLDMSHFERNQSEALVQAHMIEQAISSCDRYNFFIWYGLGSMSVEIMGIDDNDVCLVALSSEIEMGQSKVDCSVPMEIMPTWKSWKNRLTPQLDEIAMYCTPVDNS